MNMEYKDLELVEELIRKINGTILEVKAKSPANPLLRIVDLDVNRTLEKYYRRLKKDELNLKMTKIIPNGVLCECCHNVYDYETEPQEVKEGGTHICSTCWNN